MRQVSLLSREAVEKLQRDRFSSRIYISWSNGIIDDMKADAIRFEDEMLLNEM
jgi:hypothetical protein